MIVALDGGPASAYTARLWVIMWVFQEYPICMYVLRCLSIMQNARREKTLNTKHSPRLNRVCTVWYYSTLAVYNLNSFKLNEEYISRVLTYSIGRLWLYT